VVAVYDSAYLGSSYVDAQDNEYQDLD
jgi:hypothetical protein